MEKAHGVFIITLLKMLFFLVLIRVHYLILIRKMIFLGLGGGDISGINGGFGAPEKKFSISFSKVKTKFYLSFYCIIMVMIVICLSTGKKAIHLKEI